MDWQPISTAPRDGTPVLLYCPELEGSQYALAMYNGDATYSGRYGRFCWSIVAGEGSIAEKCATHWMPLPKPPDWHPGDEP